MNIWTTTKWKKSPLISTSQVRSGLRFRFESGVHPELRKAILEFGAWLREEYIFPVRVPVYVKSAARIRAADGDMVCGTFFRPDRLDVEPFIRLSTGDYLDLCKLWGKEDATLSILSCLAHELTYYYQWLNQLELTYAGEERQAKIYAKQVIEEYLENREWSNWNTLPTK